MARVVAGAVWRHNSRSSIDRYFGLNIKIASTRHPYGADQEQSVVNIGKHTGEPGPGAQLVIVSLIFRIGLSYHPDYVGDINLEAVFFCCPPKLMV